MSALEEITIVVEPPTAGGRKNREVYQYDKFADELRAHSSANVRVVEDTFDVAPPHGIILLDGYGAVAKRTGWDDTEQQIETLSRLWSAEQRKRTFCLKIERGNDGLEIIDGLQLAGGMDSADYLVAVSGRGYQTSYGASGVYALRSVAETIGCKIEYGAERYCKTTVAPFDSLAALLARYLDEYWRSVVGT